MMTRRAMIWPAAALMALAVALTACDDSGGDGPPAADARLPDDRGGAGGTGGREDIDDMGGMGGMDGTGDMGGMPFQGLALAAPPDARACEAVVAAAGPLTVRFADPLRGRSLTRAPRTALAVVSDGPMALGAIELGVEGDPAELTLVTTQCFDGSGAPLADGLEIVR